jgi:hypothetical protein
VESKNGRGYVKKAGGTLVSIAKDVTCQVLGEVIARMLKS